MFNTRVFARIMAVVFLFVPACAHAAGPVRELPPEVAFHIVVKSPLKTLAALDSYAANATRGSQFYLPAGSLEMITRLYFPFPLDTWESEDVAEVFAVVDDDSPETKPVLLIRVEDYELFVESLGDRGWEFVDEDDEAEAEPDAAPFQTVSMPNGLVMVLGLVDGQDNLVVLADNPELAAIALSGYQRPATSSKADIVVTINGSPQRGNYEAAATRTIALRKNQAATRLTRLGIKPEVARGMLAALERFAPRLAAELDRLEGGVLELTIHPDRILADLVGKFTPDSFAGEVAAHLANAAPVANRLEANIPDNAVSYSASAPLDAIIPDVRTRLGQLNADIYSMFMPELATKAKEASLEFFDTLDSGTVLANFIGGKGEYSVMLVSSKDTAAAMKAFRASMEVFNQAWAASVVDPDHALSLAVTDAESDGVPYLAVIPRPVDAEKFREFLAGFSSAVRDTNFEFKGVENMRFFMAARDGILITAFGELDEAEFLAALQRLSRKADSPMMERAAVKKLRPELPASQATIGFIDSNTVFRAALEKWSRELTGAAELTFGRAVRKTLANLHNNDSAFGMSLGVDGGNLAVRFIVPDKVANSFARNYETLQQTRRAEILRWQAGEEDDDEADDDEEEPEAA